MARKLQLSGFLEAVPDGHADAAARRLAAQLRFDLPLDPGPVEVRHLLLDVVVDCPDNLLRLFLHCLPPSFMPGHNSRFNHNAVPDPPVSLFPAGRGNSIWGTPLTLCLSGE